MAAIHGVIIGGSPALSAEYLANGDFSSTSDWTQTFAEWVISGGVATYTAGTGSNIRQTLAPSTQTGMRVVFTVNSVSGGGVYFTLSHSGGSITGTTRSAAGTYVEDVNVAGNSLSQIRFNCTGSACVIDNASLKAIL